MTTWSRTLVRTADLVLSAVALAPALVCFLLLLPVQLLVFKGKVFFVQDRVGRSGRLFRYLKLTSMAPAMGAVGRSQLEGERIPGWGRFLRKFHLDEILEVLLIMAGAESFVGPRPLVPEHAELVHSGKRAGVRPGWTGLSQLYLRRFGLLPSRVQRRLDARLAENLSLGVYLRVLAATLTGLFTRPRPSAPGPTVLSYRRDLQSRKSPPGR